MQKKNKKGKHKNHTYTSNSLCWECAKAYGDCTWSSTFEPVQGWNAKRKDICFEANGKKYISESYYVYECPEFEKEKRR